MAIDADDPSKKIAIGYTNKMNGDIVWEDIPYSFGDLRSDIHTAAVFAARIMYQDSNIRGNDITDIASVTIDDIRDYSAYKREFRNAICI